MTTNTFSIAERCLQLSASEPCEEPYFPYRITIGRGDRGPQICWNKKNVPVKTSRAGALTIFELSVPEGVIIVERSYNLDSGFNVPFRFTIGN